MKKRLILSLACFLSIQVMAQIGDAKSKLEKKVEEINAVLPVSVLQGMFFTREYISDNRLYVENQIDEDYVSLAYLVENQKQMKANLLNSYVTNPQLLITVELVVECDMDIAIRYVSKQSGKYCLIILETDELKKGLENQ